MAGVGTSGIQGQGKTISARLRLGMPETSNATTPSQRDLRERLNAKKKQGPEQPKDNNEKIALNPLTPEQILKRKQQLAEKAKLVAELIEINEQEMEMDLIEANGGKVPENSFVAKGKTKTVASGVRGNKRNIRQEIPIENLENRFNEEEDDEEEGEAETSIPRENPKTGNKKANMGRMENTDIMANMGAGASKKARTDVMTLEMLRAIRGLIAEKEGPKKCSRSMDVFTDWITKYPIQRGKPPDVPPYSGSTSAASHIGCFEGKMALFSAEEPVLCKALASTFTGKALQWIMAHKPKSIDNYDELRDAFLNAFAGAGEIACPRSDLLRIRQKPWGDYQFIHLQI